MIPSHLRTEAAESPHVDEWSRYSFPLVTSRSSPSTITVRLHGNDEDRKRKFNRTENVRPIPTGDRDFERLYRRRNDAESINRHLDDTLWLRRAHSIGHLRQTLNVITYALGINALALHLHRQRHAPPTAA